MRHPVAVLLVSLLIAVVHTGADEAPSTRRSADGLSTELLGGTATGPSRAIKFTIIEAEMERWPAPVTVTVKRSNESKPWSVLLEPRYATKQHVLQTKAGTHELTFSAPHYAAITRTASTVNGNADLGSLTLSRLPVLGGTVRTSNGSPAVGAFVDDGIGHTAKTDATGTYSVEVTNGWPARLQISYPGYSTRDVPVSKTRASATLPAQTLTKGSRVELTFQGPVTPTAVVLQKPLEGHQHYETLQTARIAEGTRTAAFTDLAKGDYILMARGREPLQQASMLITAGEGETITKDWKIEPLDVLLEVRQGEKPVRGALIHVAGVEDRWSADVRAGDDGNYAAEAWERGTYAFAVRMTETMPPVLLLDEVEGKTEATVRLALPDRKISGHVVDAAGGSPVAKATVYIQSQNDDETAGTMRVTTNDDGIFAVDPIRDGSHTIFVDTDGYVRSEPVTYRIDQATPSRDVEIRVSRGTSRPVRVVNRDGVPIAGALIVQTVNQAVTGTLTTDPLGRAVAHTPERQSCVLYVVPQQGSFAIVRLPSDPGNEETLITVREGTATLELHATTSSGEPLPYLHFVMRFDGEMIPFEVAQTLELQRGVAPVTGADGVARIDHLPPGFMELWPVRGSEQEMKDITVTGASAPVQISLKDGLNVATMTFSAKK